MILVLKYVSYALPSCNDAPDGARELCPPLLLWPVCTLLEPSCNEQWCEPWIAPLPTLSMLLPSLPMQLIAQREIYLKLIYLSYYFFKEFRA